MAIENPLRLTSLEDNTVIALAQIGSPSTVGLEYRTNTNQEWQPYAIGTEITLQNGSWVEFRNTTGTFSTSASDYYKFTMTGRTQASGNVNSMLDWTQDDPPLTQYCYFYMFQNCGSLTQAPELPSTTLANNCYSNMFTDCKSLATAPELPATTLANYCYSEMFKGCTSLKSVPQILPATTLANYCYNSMFFGCTSLTQAPEISATTVADYCCKWMFFGCTSLTKAPTILPATKLVTSCYEYMFQRCNSLNQAPEIPAITVDRLCCRNMFDGCTSLTKAPELPATTLANDCYTYMFNGCSSLTQAPELNATTLAGGCYNHLFYGCSKIDHILWKSKTIPSQTYCSDWLNGVSASGTFEYTQPQLDVASITRTTSGVPEGWNIQQFKLQTGIALKINNVDIKKATLFSKNIAKLFINGVKVKSSYAIGTDIELPSYYTKLLYVSSNGGTLDTGIPTNGNLKVGIKWSKPTSGTGSWPELFGNKSIAGFSGDYYKAFTLQLNSNGAGTQHGAHYDFFHGLYSPTEQTYGGRVDILESDPSTSDTINEFWLSPTEFSWNGQVFNIVDYANQHNIREHNDWEYQPERLDKSNMFLFTSKTGDREARVNCYNFYIIDTTTNDVLLNYVPCQIGTSVGFFDTVLQTFVTHASFVAGPAA